MNYELLTGTLGLGAGTAFFVKEKENSYIKSREVVLFSVVFVALISIAGFTGSLNQTSLSVVFILNQIYFLLLGFLFSYFFFQRFSLKLQNPLLSGILYMIGIVALGITAFIVAFNCLNEVKLGYYYSTSVIPFFIPLLVTEAYARYKKIPKEIYKSWKYPGEYYDPDLGGKDFNSGPIVRVQLLENENSLKRTPSSAPANPELKLGDWFFLVLRDYPGTVAIKNSKLVPYEWQFYKKPTLIGFRRYFDPDLNILENKIDKNFILIAERVIPES